MKAEIISIGNSFYKKCRIVMLPTEKSNMYLFTKGNSEQFIFDPKVTISYTDKFIQPQHLYILSDEEIKNDEWVLNLEHKSIFKVNDVHIDFWENDTSSFVKKIIATTNLELENCLVSNDRGSIYQKLPRPSDAFLKAYCDKGGIDEVLVECERGTHQWWTAFYKQNQNGIDNPDNFPSLLKISADNTIRIKPIKEKLFTLSELKEIAVKYGYYIRTELDPSIHIDKFLEEKYSII